MNRARRKEIDKAIDLLLEARVILEQVQSDEEDAFDNMPEGIQMSERGEAMEENLGILDEVTGTIGDVEDVLLTEIRCDVPRH